MKSNGVNDWDDIETFTKPGAKICYPFVRLSKRKTITLSAGFIHHAKEQIKGMTHVILSFSRSKNAIVFNFTDNEDDQGAIKIHYVLDHSTATIVVRPLFDYFGIDADKKDGKYIAEVAFLPNKLDYEKTWVIYLNKKTGEHNARNTTRTNSKSIGSKTDSTRVSHTDAH